jgi:S-DNA-T family DNA segregation ATPase FtsK/SpoIIIE
MASVATRSAKAIRLGLSPEKADEILGFVLAAAVVILAMALFSYYPLDPSLMHHAAERGTEVRNFIGPVGAQAASLLFAVFGLAAFLWPVMLAAMAWRRLRHMEPSDGIGRYLGVAGLLLVLPALLQIAIAQVPWRGESIASGGALGVVLAELLIGQLHLVGASIVLVVGLLISGSLAIRSTLGSFVREAGSRGVSVWHRLQLRRAQQEKRSEGQNSRRRVQEHAHEQNEREKESQRDRERERRDAAVARDAAPTTPRVMPPKAASPPPPLRVHERKGTPPLMQVRKVTVAELEAQGFIEVPERAAPARPPSASAPASSPAVRPAAEAPSYSASDAAAGATAAATTSGGGPAAKGPPPLPPLPPNVSPSVASFRIQPPAPLPPPPKAPAAPPASLAAVPAAVASPSAPRAAAPPSAPSVPAAPRAVQPPWESAPAPSVPARPAPGHFVRETRQPIQADLGFDPDEIMPELPPVNLFNCEAPTRFTDEAELMDLGEKIQQSAEHFGVDGVVEGISPGPVITTYEFKPAPGVKVSKVVNLQDDLALALKAESVRIDRMAGRSTLGIEVPNPRRSVIHLGQLLADERFRKSPSVLTMALGVDIHGQPCYFDLATMPHLLVAGATGSGKSVGLQSMITSILLKATRDEVQFIFIDPKRIELGVYADIPHLKTEVVVEPKKAANALRWAVAEMERRYRLLAEVHVRSIDYYNRAIRDPHERQRLSLKEGESEFKAEDFQPLPYYVIIIDELADLMMVASSDVEASVARLAQMARAVGIHLIVATQRPSVDVLTGTIKANFPCRLAFATASRHDSRTILDQIGSERLLGKGDALFMPPGSSRIMRLHGAYISEQETAGLIRWLKRRGKPNYDPNVTKSPEGEEEGGGRSSGGPADDDLFEEAARLVVAERQASASFLQRRMRVGFSRAARLIDLLEADGLLGPAQGSKPRDVLVPPDYFDEIDRSSRE